MPLDQVVWFTLQYIFLNVSRNFQCKVLDMIGSQKAKIGLHSVAVNILFYNAYPISLNCIILFYNDK
jgi:hypothetical protein